jgi:hypothetical protein
MRIDDPEGRAGTLREIDHLAARRWCAVRHLPFELPLRVTLAQHEEGSAFRAHRGAV